MARDLASLKCVPCQGGVPPLKGEEIQDFYKDLRNGWEVVEEHHLKKRFKFPDFKGAPISKGLWSLSTRLESRQRRSATIQRLPLAGDLWTFKSIPTRLTAYTSPTLSLLPKPIGFFLMVRRASL